MRILRLREGKSVQKTEFSLDLLMREEFAGCCFPSSFGETTIEIIVVRLIVRRCVEQGLLHRIANRFGRLQDPKLIKVLLATQKKDSIKTASIYLRAYQRIHLGHCS